MRLRRGMETRRRRRIRKLRLLVLLLVLILLGSAAFAYGLVTAIAAEIPKLDPARRQQERNSYIFASDGHSVLAVLRGSENRVVVPSERIADVMKQAIVAIEDRRFFEHRGIDIRGIARAVWNDIRNSGLVEGGSTITQQFVKNAYTDSSRSISRKLKEAALAWQLEQHWSKDRILTAYLNTIYYANGAYGIQQAAKIYFHHGAERLTLAEAALLAGIPRDPSLYDPVTNPRAARARRAAVLLAMRDQEMITERQLRRASNAPLPRPEDVRLPGRLGKAPYFASYVQQLLVDEYGTARVFGGGLEVVTSIDLRLQQIAREAVAKWLTPEQGPAAALVAIDPNDGRVLAMVGGENYRKNQFNLAVQGRRQPGSAFKPFVLATALAQGVSPSTAFVSKPVTISLGDRLWYVRNYESNYRGTIDLATATELSDNTVYAQLTELVRPASVARMARSLGIRSPVKGYFSIGLGGEEVNPLEMARAYSAFANGGKRIHGSIFGDRPRAILRVNDQDNAPVAKEALSENTAAIVTDLLQRVVRSGTGQRAQLSDGRPVAGKTGTTENYGDAWFVGYTPQLVVAVWVGYPDELKPMLTEYHGRAVAGGTIPALIWRAFTEKALEHLGAEPQPFRYPEYPYASPQRVVFRDGIWQADNGYCRNTTVVWYFSGRGPGRTADCKPNEVEVPTVIGLTLEEAQLRLASQPLAAEPIYKPATPGQRVGVVVQEIPPVGSRLSTHDTVKVVLAKAIHGVVPDVVGSTLDRARDRLKRLKLDVRVRTVAAPAARRARVIRQSPRPGVAAGDGLRVTLVVGAGRPAGSRTASPTAHSATGARSPG